MNIFQNILTAKDADWIQLVIFIIIFAVAILKKLFSSVKNYVEEQSELEEQQQASPSTGHAKYIYEQDAFKTIEQIREEKIAQIRAAYGIAETPKSVGAEHFAEPMIREQVPAQDKMSASPPIHQEPTAVHMPRIKKKAKHAEAIHAKERPQKEHASKPAEKAAEKHHELLVRLSSPEDLRNAILYQEVLGKPLALRDE